jgi:dihydroflavonol-4-reductase
MRVFLTGGTGFLGSHIADALVASGHDVVALVRPLKARTARTQVAATEVVAGDILDPESLRGTMDGCDAVVHSAALVAFAPVTAARQRAVNVEGTANVLAEARAAGVQRFVHTSSIAAVGRPPAGGVADEETRYDWPPGMSYNETKRDAERLVQRAAGLETVVLNPAMVFGPGEIYKRTLTLFRLIKWGLMPLVPPGGTTLCDVRDVAAAHVAALTQGVPGARYILGGPHLTFRELATTIAELTSGARPLAELPAALLRAAAVPLAALVRLGVSLPFSLGDMLFLDSFGYYSSARAEAALGYHTRGARESLGDAARWFEARHLL